MLPPKSRLVDPSVKSLAIIPGTSKFAVSRTLKSPIDDIILEMDSRYLHFLDDLRQQGATIKPPFQWQRDPYARNFCYGELQFDISSPLCRASSLVLASSLKHNGSNEDSCQYFKAFCANANAAIRDGNWKDLVYASHIMTVMAWHCPLDTKPTGIMTHFLQFCRLTKTVNETTSQRLVEDVIYRCDQTINAAWLVTAFAYFGDGTRTREIWDLLWKMMEITSWLTRKPYRVEFQILDKKAAGYLNFLNYHANIHLAIMLNEFTLEIGERDSWRLETTRARAIEIFKQIQNLIASIRVVCELLDCALYTEPYLFTEYYELFEFDVALLFPSLISPQAGSSDPRVIRLALLYCYAELLTNVLDPSADESDTCRNSILQSSVAICRLIHQVENSLSQDDIGIRSLFWAGLCFCRENYVPGEYPLVCSL